MPRKKKTEDQIIKGVSKLVAEVTLQETEPTIVNVVKGSHLTVTHYSNGKTICLAGPNTTRFEPCKPTVPTT